MAKLFARNRSPRTGRAGSSGRAADRDGVLLTVPLLIPVLTTFALPLGYMGDILGGGFILSLAGFLVAAAALDTGSPYAQLGSSRAKTLRRSPSR